MNEKCRKLHCSVDGAFKHEHLPFAIVFASNDTVLVCQFGKMRTEEWEELRFTLNNDDIAVKMFPNRVTAKALEDTKYREVTPLLLAPTFVYKTRFR